MSKQSKGNYYVKKTITWLQAQGYVADKAEVKTRFMYKAKDGTTKTGFRTKDFWGADIIARNRDRIIFIQVKSNKGDISKGVRELSQDGLWPIATSFKAVKEHTDRGWVYRSVPNNQVCRWVVYWPPRAKEPNIREVINDCKV